MQIQWKAISFSTATQAAFWITLFSFIWYISAQTLGIPDAFARVTLIFACHLFNFYVCYSFLVPRYYEHKKYALAIGGLLLLLILLTPIRLLIERRFLDRNTFIVKQYLTKNNARGLVLFSEISIAAFASLLRLAVSNNTNKRKVAAIEKLQLQSELQFLKAQMTPHFLFNTINNIYSLTLTKSDKAPSALMKLSGLLRYLLYECHGKVSVRQEVDALRDYAELFQLRYEEPVKLRILYTEQDVGGSMEPMLLIPLLENALKHSGLGMVESAFANIEVIREGVGLHIRVTNSKSDLPLADNSGGIGLANIRKRLETVYPEAYTFIVQDGKDVFAVDLKIPLT